MHSAFAFAQDLEIDKDDNPVSRALRESGEKLASCYDRLQQFLVMIQPSTIGTMTCQIETEDQATQVNAPLTPSDTKLDFEHDPELDFEDQTILAIESTDTLDNHIDNSDLTFDNIHNSSINDCPDIIQTIDNSDIGDPKESKTETIDDNMQDQTSNINNEDQNNSKFESTRIVHIGTKDKSDPKSFESGTNLDYCFQEAIRLQHKQEIRAIDFGPNLHTQVSECADINAIRSNNLTCFNCKYPDHFTKDCPEPNKMQQPQSNNRQNNSIESAIEAPT